MVEARSPSEAVEEQGNERRRVHCLLLVTVGVGGKEPVRAGVIAEAIDVATQNDDQTLRPRKCGAHTHTHTDTHAHTHAHPCTTPQAEDRADRYTPTHTHALGGHGVVAEEEER